jgi:sigma-E factor negative regulatory protein RseC
MLETRAVIVQVMGEDALVESRQSAGCGHCSKENGCSSSKLSQMFCSAPRQFKVKNPNCAKVGDEVEISMEDGVLLRSSVVMYVVPLSLMLSGSILGAHWSPDLASRDGYAILGSLVGLLLGFLASNVLALRIRMSAVAQSVKSL